MRDSSTDISCVGSWPPMLLAISTTVSPILDAGVSVAKRGDPTGSDMDCIKAVEETPSKAAVRIPVSLAVSLALINTPCVMPVMLSFTLSELSASSAKAENAATGAPTARPALTAALMAWMGKSSELNAAFQTARVAFSGEERLVAKRSMATCEPKSSGETVGSSTSDDVMDTTAMLWSSLLLVAAETTVRSAPSTVVGIVATESRTHPRASTT
mmetsp:Transcript_135870/g.322028  ORF Transcript_135870/g.322028 Transcript_135870/m.322028 type:complete len:214 (-) Transcript_135870:610-1251(-)